MRRINLWAAAAALGGCIWVGVVGCGEATADPSAPDPSAPDPSAPDPSAPDPSVPGGDGGLASWLWARVHAQRVTDGDTLVVGAEAGVTAPDGRALDGERVRLLGIDAPEIGRGGMPSDCFAEQARAFVIDAVKSPSLTLTFDETRCRPAAAAGCRGDYGRLLGYVEYVAGGERKVLNEALLATGHAKVLRGAARFQHRDSARYEALERAAARGRVGVWQCP